MFELLTYYTPIYSVLVAGEWTEDMIRAFYNKERQIVTKKEKTKNKAPSVPASFTLYNFLMDSYPHRNQTNSTISNRFIPDNNKTKVFYINFYNMFI